MSDAHYPTILLHSGSYFNLLAPELSSWTTFDVAHALSHICRFTGHCSPFYSVAEHAVRVSYQVPPEHALAALHHDDAEAFLGDVSSPLKALLPRYKEIEREVELQIARHLNLDFPLDPCVKRADLVLLATEQRDLMPAAGRVWKVLAGIEPLPERIEPLSMKEALTRYLDRHYELSAWRPAP